MAKLFDSITDELQRFIHQQQMFFVATAPLSGQGRVNLSPKGLDSFRILTPHQVAYLDLTGSGNETSAHLLENGRITLMFCAFQGAPKILRLYGTGTVILPNSSAWDDMITHFPMLPGFRQIVVAEIERIQTSCGTGIPLYQYEGQRDALVKWASHKGEQGIRDYQQEKNSVSIDGLATPLGRQL